MSAPATSDYRSLVGADFVLREDPNSGFRFRVLKHCPTGYSKFGPRFTTDAFVIQVFRDHRGQPRLVTTRTVRCDEFLQAHEQTQ